ncbi:sugar phosphate isomerase/epimerase [Paraburkholderia sp. BL10I2N1]|uniref:sugar phosphate isomerase/epimerase family protein n=1 Tax=Paraburkholderia sp. BL10I2N1 TaxID=1938796 RepID=UPI0010E2C054|nr:sugar phosphate isomerase/epimerase [Paraburkholderia sp. BL10I2N1]TDN67253.1 sugar phosphate isomerase/epimerase [Paraburkholderia sp. BL10I2N1]
MTQRLDIYQSLWAMERRHTDGCERSLEENIELIAQAGFNGVSGSYTSRDEARRLSRQLAANGMQIEVQAFPRRVDELQPVLELATEFGAHHIDLQPDVRPRRIDDCLKLIDGWTRLAEQVDFPVYIETHRDRMTTDLYFTLDLLDARPDMKLLGDISHYLVGREFAWPVSDENHAAMHRILDHSWAFHGRVASRQQVQIEISFEPHKMWVDLFFDWWRYGFESWRRRAGPDDSLTFTCELGPKPYAIIGRDGNDTTDRWAESLLMRDRIRALWNDVSGDEKGHAETVVRAASREAEDFRATAR